MCWSCHLGCLPSLSEVWQLTLCPIWVCLHEDLPTWGSVGIDNYLASPAIQILSPLSSWASIPPLIFCLSTFLLGWDLVGYKHFSNLDCAWVLKPTSRYSHHFESSQSIVTSNSHGLLAISYFAKPFRLDHLCLYLLRFFWLVRYVQHVLEKI